MRNWNWNCKFKFNVALAYLSGIQSREQQTTERIAFSHFAFSHFAFRIFVLQMEMVCALSHTHTLDRSFIRIRYSFSKLELHSPFTDPTPQ